MKDYLSQHTKKFSLSLSVSPNPSGTCYTASCDVYSFGVVLWEMITRHKPYLSGTQGKTMAPQSVVYRVATGSILRTQGLVNKMLHLPNFHKYIV